MDAVLPVRTSFAGIAFGAYLNRRSARSAVADERAFQERRSLLDRQEAAAASFQQELTGILSDLPQSSAPPT